MKTPSSKITRTQAGFAFLTLMLLVGFAGTERVDVALSGAHGPATAAGGVGDIASVARLGDPARSLDVLKGWGAYDKAVAGLGTAFDSVTTTSLRGGYLFFDVVLMVSLFVLLTWCRKRLLAMPGLRPPEEGTTSGGLSLSKKAARSVVDKSLAAMCVYLAADFFETLLATRALDVDGGEGLARLIGALSLVKWIGLVVALLGLLIGWVTPPLESERSVGATASAGARKHVPTLTALRGQLLIAVLLVGLLLGLSGDLGREIDDVLVAATERFWPAVLTVVLVLITCGALYIGGRLSLGAYQGIPSGAPVLPGKLVAAGVGIVVLGLLAWRAWHWAPAVTWALAIPGVAIFLWSILTYPKPIRDFVVPAGTAVGITPGQRRLAGAIAALPAVALSVAMVRALVTVWTAPGQRPWAALVWALVFLVVAWLAVVAALCLPQFSTWEWLEEDTPSLAVVVAALVGAIMLGVIGALLPVHWWMSLGTPAVLFLVGLVLTGLVTGLVLLSDRIAPSGALAMLRLRRMPFLTMLIVWGVLASAFDSSGLYYDIRILALPNATTTTTPPKPPTEQLQDWIKAQPAIDQAASSNGQMPIHSLVFVAAAGGGIRAAYWTAVSWDCALGTACNDGTQDLSDQVFFASGVSGGAVGLASVRAHSLSRAKGTINTETGLGWVDHDLGADFLAPSIAALAFRDIPNSVARLPLAGWDRMATLEQAFEHYQNTLQTDFYSQVGTFPVLSFSATSVEDGCRLAMSTVHEEEQDATDRPKSGATNCSGADTKLPSHEGTGNRPVRDAYRYLCPAPLQQSIRLSTAAFTAARFPFVSPSGGLRQCTPNDGKAPEVNPTYALDGGLFDNSGGEAVTHMWRAIEGDVIKHNTPPSTSKDGANPPAESTEPRTCIIPRLIVIDSHYASNEKPTSSHRPIQSLGPTVAQGQVYQDRSSRALAEATRTIASAAKEQAELCGRGAAPGDAVVQLYPIETAGPTGPLGWTLSTNSRHDLKNQIQKDEHNRVARATIRKWFDRP